MLRVFAVEDVNKFKMSLMKGSDDDDDETPEGSSKHGDADDKYWMFRVVVNMYLHSLQYLSSASPCLPPPSGVSSPSSSEPLIKLILNLFNIPTSPLMHKCRKDLLRRWQYHGIIA
ncbi:hypothetical protein LOK49_LG11G02886 [Camellia lanceoleosa]|uniref:Uncharacterized protein n=1 Tax=Camellia lanceoleosa TaxID=1840588 RepID=A0ACC0G3S1_9ERIC|nr:hypothetical protein LOK49_LG11G02886 [Camellia lanceoleosa]